MSRNNRLLQPGTYSFSGEAAGFEMPEDCRLCRMFKGDHVSLRIEFAGEIDYPEVFLHTDAGEGDWIFIPFKKSGSGRFSLDIEIKRSGLYSCRFAAADDNTFFWEPGDYHRFLVDPLEMDGLALYTLIPNVSGRADEWIKKLPEINRMGFNAIHLLPVSMMGSSESPYSASDLFKIDKAWGSSIEVFKRFAADAGALGIMLCLDIVLNHISVENPLCREKAHWIKADGERSDGLRRAGCWHQNSWISWEDLVLINYDHPDEKTRADIYEYMLSYILFWIEAAGGNNIMIRLDNLHSSNQRFINWLLPEVRKNFPEVIILSEYFGAEEHLNEAVENFGLNLLMANTWEYPFAPVLQNYLESLHRKSMTGRYLIEPSSHDTGSIPELFGSAASTVPRYLCCALMGTGQTGIVQGVENGNAEKINFIGRSAEIRDYGSCNFTDLIKSVNGLMMEHRCFRKKGNIDFIETGNDSLIVCTRRDDDCEYLIAANFDTGRGHSFHFNSTGNLQFLLSENAERESEDKIFLQACGVCVLITADRS